MASRAGLFDFEFDKKSINDPEINNKGVLDPDFSTAAAAGTFNPPGGSLLLTGAAAILSIGMVASAGAAALTGGTPSLVIGTVLSPSGASLTLATPTPHIDSGLPATKGSLALSGATPSQGTGINPAGGSLVTSGATPVNDTGLPAGGGSLALTGSQPGLSFGGSVSFSPGGGSLTLSGATSPSLALDIDNPNGNVLTLAGGTPQLNIGLVATGGALNLAGATPRTDLGVSPAAAALVLGSNTPSVFVGPTFQPSAGSLALTGATPTQDTGLPATKGSLALTGSTPAVFVGATLLPPGGVLSLSGGTPSLSISISPASGSLAVIGNTPVQDSGFPIRDLKSWQNAALAAGATSIYRLNETSGTTAKDIGPGAHNGSYVANFTLGAAGPIADNETALTLDGTTTGGKVTIAPGALGTTCSIELWAKITGDSVDHFETLLADTVNGVLVGMFFTGINARKVDVNYGGNIDHFGGTQVVQGTWVHIVLSVTAGSGTIYVNGVSDGTFASFPSPSFTGIGKGSSINEVWNGSIADVAFYPGVALSAGQVSNLYALRQPTPGSAAVLALAGGAPIQGLGLSPAGGSLILSGSVPQVLAPLILNPVGATLSLTGGTPQRVVGTVLAPGGASFTLAGGQSRLNLSLFPTGGTLVLTGNPASFNAGVAFARLIHIAAENRNIAVGGETRTVIIGNEIRVVVIEEEE